MHKFFSYSLLPAICFLLYTLPAAAQNTPAVRYVDTARIKLQQQVKVKKPKPIEKEFSIGMRLNTDGWSIFADKGWVKSEEKESDKFYDLRFAQLEFGEHKHPKEIKGSNKGATYSDKPRPYKYGKINNFYVLKIGYGKRRLIAGKPDPGTVSIHWVYAGGLALGFLKPYYLDVYQSNGTKQVKYDDDPDFFVPVNPNDQARIIGKSSLLQGIGETKIIPGIQAKTALHFDFASFRKRKLAIETGLNAELYIKKMAIMANAKAQPFILNGYLSLQFGNRK